MLLSEMKNPEKCNHKKIAVEKIKTLELKKPFQSESINFDNLEGELQEIVLCLDCGKELERNF